MSARTSHTPLLWRPDAAPTSLERLPLGSHAYDEDFIQNLAFEHPSCLPIREIDRAYENLVPICMELQTDAGRLDALYVTPSGRLVILEAKLCRNPEARRKVVGQVLDYAREISTWDYEALQREVSVRTGRKGNALFEIVSAAHPDISESEFVDEVERSLRLGRYLLLIVGDGIREGAGAIATFLEDFGMLEFTLGLVELALYKSSTTELLIMPQVVAKTVIIDRRVISLPDGAQVQKDADSEDGSPDPDLLEATQFYRGFWKEFVDQIRLDDPGQPIPNTTRSTNLYFSMPPSGSICWISAYFSRRNQRVGVYLTFTKGSFGDQAFEILEADREAIDDELGLNVTWQSKDGKHHIIIRREFNDVWAKDQRAKIMEFFADAVNRFVNAFRPRLERIASDLK